MPSGRWLPEGSLHVSAMFGRAIGASKAPAFPNGCGLLTINFNQGLTKPRYSCAIGRTVEQGVGGVRRTAYPQAIRAAGTGGLADRNCGLGFFALRHPSGRRVRVR